MTNRKILRELDTTGASDGDVPVYDAATDQLVYAPPANAATALVALTTSVGGTPTDVWDANDEHVLTEVLL